MRLIPKEIHFSDNFEKLADKIEAGGKLLVEILDDFSDLDAKSFRMKEIEHEADDIANIIYKDLHATFITPLDREDIFALANTMDNIMDMIESAVTKMQMYRIKKPVPEQINLAILLHRSIVLVSRAIHGMRHRGDNAHHILALCIEINSLENEADTTLRQALLRLFETEKNVMELIKSKEILEDIENATDICEDVSNIIEGIILKYG
ncbi:MAG: hypothetical protein CSYNP_00571 [Syntrophus sp. SKADARSKE-3]|nr:hypothetical protein [Syntrophus sp. SKADARSKE-3]